MIIAYQLSYSASFINKSVRMLFQAQVLQGTDSLHNTKEIVVATEKHVQTHFNVVAFQKNKC